MNKPIYEPRGRAREASENLDTCPYCGGPGVIIADLGGFRGSCKACFAQTGLAITPQEAAERWNRRTENEP